MACTQFYIPTAPETCHGYCRGSAKARRVEVNVLERRETPLSCHSTLDWLSAWAEAQRDMEALSSASFLCPLPIQSPVADSESRMAFPRSLFKCKESSPMAQEDGALGKTQKGLAERSGGKALC